MSIAETVTLEDGVSGPAMAAAAAVSKLKEQLQALAKLKSAGLSDAAKIAVIQAKANAAIDQQVQKEKSAANLAAQKAEKAQALQDKKQLHAIEMANIKAALAEKASAAKQAAADERAAKKQAIADERAAAKQAAADERAAKKQALADEKALKKKEAADEKAAKKQAIADEKALKKQERDEERKRKADDKAAKKQAIADDKKRKADDKKAKKEFDASHAGMVQKSITQELQKQAKLQAEIAAFDAQRVRRTAELEAHLKNMHQNATAGLGDSKRDDGQQGGLASFLGAGADAAGWISVVKQVYGAIFGMIKEIIGGAMSLTLQAQGFKDDALDSFEVLLGGEKAAAEMYDKIIKVSHQIGLNKEQAVSETKRLLAAGYKQEQIPRLLESIADLNMVRDGGGAMFEKVLEQIKTKGSLDPGAIKKLSKLGIGEEDIYKRLAESHHKSITEIKGLIKTGQIKADEGIEAALAAAEAKYGGRAKKDAEDVLTLLMTVKSQLVELFDSVDIGPLQAVLKNVRDLLDSAVGKEMKEALTGMMSALFEAIFGPLNDKSGMEGIAKTLTGAFKSIGEFIKDVSPSIKAFIAGFMDGFGAAIPYIKEAATTFMAMLGAVGGGKGVAHMIGEFFGKAAVVLLFFAGVATATMAAVGAAFGVIATSVMWVWNVVIDVVTAIINIWDGMFDAMLGDSSKIDGILGSISNTVANWISSLKELFSFGGSDAGNALGQGMSDGLAGSMETAIAQAGEAAQRIINHVKAILGIHSPSKVFEEIGQYTTEGMAGGLESGASKAAAAAKRMATNVVGAGAQGARVPSAGGTANDNGGTGGEGAINITVQVVAKPGASAEEQGQQAGEAAAKVLRTFHRRVAASR